MPSPNIIAAGLARHTKDAAIVVLGNSIALYNPPIRVAENRPCWTASPAGAWWRGSQWAWMGRRLLLRPDPIAHAGEVQEAHVDLDHQGLDHAGALRLERPLQQAAARQHLAAPDPGRPPPAGPRPGGGSVETYDLSSTTPIPIPTSSFSGYIQAQALMTDGYWRPVDERSVDRAPTGRAWPDPPGGGDRRGAERLYSEHVTIFYNRCLHVYPGQ